MSAVFFVINFWKLILIDLEFSGRRLEIRKILRVFCLNNKVNSGK